MNKTGPSVNAFLISEKIRPGSNAPSLGVKALTLTDSLVFKYLTVRSSISCEISIEGENPVRINLSDSDFERISATVLTFQPGERISK